MHWRRKWQPTPVFLPGESQGQQAWWAAVFGVAQSRTRLYLQQKTQTSFKEPFPFSSESSNFPIVFLSTLLIYRSDSRLPQIYVFNDDHVVISLFFSYSGLGLVVVFMTSVFWHQTHCEKAFFSLFISLMPIFLLLTLPCLCLTLVLSP